MRDVSEDEPLDSNLFSFIAFPFNNRVMMSAYAAKLVEGEVYTVRVKAYFTNHPQIFDERIIIFENKS